MRHELVWLELDPSFEPTVNPALNASACDGANVWGEKLGAAAPNAAGQGGGKKRAARNPLV